MPKFKDTDLEQHKTPTGYYGFSATKIGDLQATEYTLVTIVMDESGSTSGFKAGLEKAVQEIVLACRHSPRADNLLLRLVAFGSFMREVHGFKLLEQCNPDDYKDCYGNGGSTALYDAAENAIQASQSYAEQLANNDFLANGIIFVLTDGDDNQSKCGQAEVAAALAKCVISESMESLVSVLIGVNVQQTFLAQYLADFKHAAGFTQYVELDSADAKTLAKLAEFVSKSISSQSQMLGTGGPSQSLTF